MPELSISLRDDIVEAMKLPDCEALQIPFPPEPAKIRLPGGGRIDGIANATEKIPDDCALTFSLYAQLGPVLGNFKCIFAVLSLLGPLIDIINSVSKLKLPPLDAVQKFGEAAEEVTECVLQFTTPLGLAQFIVDILDLILKILKCTIQALQSAVDMFHSFGLDILKAKETDNAELLALLECAQANALNSAQGSLMAIEPIPAILDTISAVMEIVGAEPIEFPAIETPKSVEAVEDVIVTLETVVDVITTVRNAIPL